MKEANSNSSKQRSSVDQKISRAGPQCEMATRKEMQNLKKNLWSHEIEEEDTFSYFP
jgi:hypothetical protein